jgi:hypothetical protein
VSAVHQLRDHLLSISPGPVMDSAKLASLLDMCWDQFKGSRAQGMDGAKLYGRIENLTWQPPVLSFKIERHGGTVHGSTRADVHLWSVDLDAMTAECDVLGQRQLKPMQSRLDVRPIAEELARVIRSRQEDERLKWARDGSVRVLMSKILPTGSAVAQTLQGRRRRLDSALGDLLRGAGWSSIRANTYAPPNLADD